VLERTNETVKLRRALGLGGVVGDALVGQPQPVRRTLAELLERRGDHVELVTPGRLPDGGGVIELGQPLHRDHDLP
jgi:alkanesulfonate monooxygenase SsuD/methylene tetrahydromethanopterin reductase-like flavin-dependent oxidoreductase (luciferase family)